MLRTKDSQGQPEAENKGQAESPKAAAAGVREDFSKYMMKSEAASRINDKKGRFIFLSKKIVSELHLRAGTPCRWEEADGSLVATPLRKPIAEAKIIFNPYSNSFMAVLPRGMRHVRHINAGDYVEWRTENGWLSLEKVSLEDVTPIVKLTSGGKHGMLRLPKAMAPFLGLEGKTSCEWKEEGNCLVITPLELEKKNMHTSKIMEYSYSGSLGLYIPRAVQWAIRPGDEVIIKGREGKLYMWRMEDFPGETGNRLLNITMVRGYGSDAMQATIPNSIAKWLNIKKRMHGVWTPGKGKLWLELMQESPHITEVTEDRSPSRDIFSVRLPDGIGKSFYEGKRIALEIKDEKLYIQNWHS